VIAVTMCGTTPRIPPNAATMPALEPRDRPGADGVHRTGAGRGDHHEGGQQKGNAHRSNLPVRALLRHTLLAVFGTLAEWDAAVAKGAGSAERPATRRDRACAASRPSAGTSCIEFSSAKVVMHIAGALGVQAAVSGRRSRVYVAG
jgi:hypothetical protein